MHPKTKNKEKNTMTTAAAIHATEIIPNPMSLVQDIPLSRIQESKTNPRRHRSYINNLKLFFGDRKLDCITVAMVEAYRDERRQQPSKHNPKQTVKGATVNRELECLKCMLDFATKRLYIAEYPASEVKHFNELRERPARRMLTIEEERRILDAAPSSRRDHSSRSDRRKNIQRGLFTALVSSGF